MDVDARGRVEVTRRRGSHQRLGLANVGLAEEKLAVEVREVDRVEVDLVSAASTAEAHDFNVGEADKDEVLHCAC